MELSRDQCLQTTKILTIIDNENVIKKCGISLCTHNHNIDYDYDN